MSLTSTGDTSMTEKTVTGRPHPLSAEVTWGYAMSMQKKQNGSSVETAKKDGQWTQFR